MSFIEQTFGFFGINLSGLDAIWAEKRRLRPLVKHFELDMKWPDHGGICMSISLWINKETFTTLALIKLETLISESLFSRHLIWSISCWLQVRSMCALFQSLHDNHSDLLSVGGAQSLIFNCCISTPCFCTNNHHHMGDFVNYYLGAKALATEPPSSFVPTWTRFKTSIELKTETWHEIQEGKTAKDVELVFKSIEEDLTMSQWLFGFHCITLLINSLNFHLSMHFSHVFTQGVHSSLLESNPEEIWLIDSEETKGLNLVYHYIRYIIEAFSWSLEFEFLWLVQKWLSKWIGLEKSRVFSFAIGHHWNILEC